MKTLKMGALALAILAGSNAQAVDFLAHALNIKAGFLAIPSVPGKVASAVVSGSKKVASTAANSRAWNATGEALFTKCGKLYSTYGAQLVQVAIDKGASDTVSDGLASFLDFPYQHNYASRIAGTAVVSAVLAYSVYRLTRSTEAQDENVEEINDDIKVEDELA